MTMITVLAGSILLLAVVLGVRAGQRQVELQRQQRIGIALQQAIEYRAETDYTAALEQYRTVLVLDPANQLANEGSQSMLQMLEQSGAGTSSAPAIEATSNAAPTESANPTTTLVATSSSQTADSNEAAWQEAERSLKAGRPQISIDKLLQIRQLDPTYRSDELQTQLFTAYVQLASQQDSEDKLQEALVSLENALVIRPTATEIKKERDLLSDYLDMDSFYNTNWAESIRLLKALKASDPNYRDVTKRLLEATIAYGDQLLAEEPCQALPQYVAAMELAGATPLLSEKQSNTQLACTTFETAVALSGTVTSTLSALGTPNAQTTDGTATTGTALPTSGLRGRILYGSHDVNDGRTRILAQSAANGNILPTIVVEDASQPNLRSDGQRLAFHNLRGDMGGVSSFDPASGLMIRFTSFAEDALPSWNANSSRIAFASTRESDRRWRLYLVWAEQDGETISVGYGEAPAWHPTADLLAYRGCDQTGNNCGLWQMDGSGGNQVPLTTAPSDNRPAWSPDGRSVVFMSDGRTGNFDIFRLDTTSHQVSQLTDSASLDLLPTVSPDGQSVAFVSNRDGAWKIYVVAINGGADRLLAPIRGDFGDWQSQKLDWVN